MAKKHISPLRSRDSFRRKPGRKPPRSVTLIVCEGEKTEPFYFEALRRHYGLSNAEIVIADNTRGSAPVSVVEFAERKARNESSYDRIFCVFDRDAHENFERARQQIRDLAEKKRRPLPIAEIISIPCFELWILLHFERSDAAFENCVAVVRRIRGKHLPGYSKSDDFIMNALLPRLDDAMANAEWLERRAMANEWNPYTSAHRLVRHMKTESERKNESVADS
ncbi:MAG: RloB family protein [Azoarcus sp.]|jgi:hypothetical protein|nr:RloB family protein [Azoarcus sp.]